MSVAQIRSARAPLAYPDSTAVSSSSFPGRHRAMGQYFNTTITKGQPMEPVIVVIISFSSPFSAEVASTNCTSFRSF